MVGIAVCDVGLVAACDLSLKLIKHVIVTAGSGVNNVNVGIKLVELCDVSIESGLKLCSTHGMVEGDGYLAAIITIFGYLPTKLGDILVNLICKIINVCGGGVVTACHCNYVKKHNCYEKNGCNNSFHVFCFPFGFCLFC